MKRTFLIALALITTLTLVAQNKQESALKREVTLYNPYKPSLPDVVKKSFLPDMTDTAKVRPDFKYEVKTQPFMPPYTISPIKAASLIPDPLPKLYNSYVNLGFGNHITPLAEISISNQRSKKGNIGLYARHFSTNGNIVLEDALEKAFAGYMDNDVMLYGRKFFRKAVFEGSLGYNQKSRYAYGYDTALFDYEPDKKDIRLNYNNTGASFKLKSITLDSSDLAYDFGIDYGFFFTEAGYNQHSFDFSGEAAKIWKQFYVGAGAKFGYYIPSDSVSDKTKYIASLSPFIAKSTREWNVKLGFSLVTEKGLTGSSKLHVYPDLRFGFNIVPSYLSFIAELSGRLEQNQPVDVIGKNPFLFPGKQVYDIKNTNYSLIAKAGLSGETGIEGRYNLWGSYSIIDDYLLFSNYILTDGPLVLSHGNYFVPRYDQAEILNLHGDISGNINEKFSFDAGGNYYRYTLAENEYAWNRPDWDAKFGLKYNLRDKIIAGIGINAIGQRYGHVTLSEAMIPVSYQSTRMPYNLNFNLGAEYRYTRILSFWVKFNNISFSRYSEWLYYPSQRFFFMAGFTYSL
jgi:hypothetical protein